MFLKYTLLKKILSTVCMIAILLPTASVLMTAQPKLVQAAGITVPGDSDFSYNEIMDNLMNYVTNRLAVAIANQLLQAMTASVVEWINKGFDGSPTFLTNPEGFFLDVADQVTGDFLNQDGGVLSQLCSPFSFDLRLNLALNQAKEGGNIPYTCTLGTIIENSKNAVETAGQNSGINVYGSEDGATIGNFIQGDFSQGGWTAFMAYSIEPQNNPIGATLMAKSDLQAAIDSKKSDINTDLNRGSGFLSYNKCEDITASMTGSSGGVGIGLSLDDIAQLNQQGNQKVDLRENGSGYFKKTVDEKTNAPKYERCQTQTPGSIIGGTLQRQLNVPADKMVLIDSINDSIDQMLGALVNQMLSKGLAALSSPGSGTRGSNRSYLSQLAAEASNQNSRENQNLAKRGAAANNALVKLTNETLTRYDDSLALLAVSKGNFSVAISCYENKIANPLISSDPDQKMYLENQVAIIKQKISIEIDPVIVSIGNSKVSIQKALSEFQDSYASTTADFVPEFTGEYIDEKFSRLEAVIGKSAHSTQSSLAASANAEELFKATETKTKELNKAALDYTKDCNEYEIPS